MTSSKSFENGKTQVKFFRMCEDALRELTDKELRREIKRAEAQIAKTNAFLKTHAPTERTPLIRRALGSIKREHKRCVAELARRENLPQPSPTDQILNKGLGLKISQDALTEEYKRLLIRHGLPLRRPHFGSDLILEGTWFEFEKGLWRACPERA